MTELYIIQGTRRLAQDINHSNVLSIFTIPNVKALEGVKA